MNEYPHRQPDEPALDYYERVARMADADEGYQAWRVAPAHPSSDA